MTLMVEHFQPETGSLRETLRHTQIRGKGWIGIDTLHSLRGSGMKSG